MDEAGILQHIQSLVDQEHELRSRSQRGDIGEGAEHLQLRQLEEALDQAWDLLRQRRARRDAGQDPDQAAIRPVSEVEGYIG
jgi:hypothetical protein